MTVSTMTRPTSHELIRFLLARVGEDEVELKRMARTQNGNGTGAETGVCSLARLRGEAAAKRKLIGSLQQLLVLRDQPSEKAVREHAAQMLRTMALPYESHSAFRSEWRP